MKKLTKALSLTLGIILIASLAGCSQSTSSSSNSQVGGFAQDPNRPDRVAEIYGKVKSVEGNKVVITEMERLDKPAEMTEEDRAKRREQMQSLSEEERKQLRDANEKPTGKSFEVTVPVGIPVKVKEAGPDGEVKDGSLTDIKSGIMISIWTENSAVEGNLTAEYVNISMRQ